nr:zinc finger, CCHC-type [Tanacetum cinerariifolium]
MAAAMKHMALNFVKLEKFEGVNFRRWHKKMHFLLSNMSVVYVLTTPMTEDGDFKHTLKHLKEELTLVELGSHLRIKESLRAQDNDKPKGNNVAGPSVFNMVEHNNSSGYNDNKGKRKHHDTKADPNKKPKVTCWKCAKPGHLKKDCKASNIGNKSNGSGTKGSVDGSSNSLKGQNMFNKSLQVYYVTYVSDAYFVQDDVAWWVDFGETMHVCKDRSLVHGRGCVDLRFSYGKVVSLLNVLHVPNIRKNLVSSSVLNNCGYKQMIESNKFALSKHGVFIAFGYLSNHMFRLNIVNDNITSAFMLTSKLNDSILWHVRLGHANFKRMQDMSKDGLILAFDMDTKKCKTCMLTKITKKPFQTIKRKTKVLELIYSDLYDLHATISLWNKKYFVTFIDDASRFCYVYLLHLKDEALDKFKVFKTEVELQQGSLIKRFRTDRGFAINSIIESRDAIFDENRFSSVSRPSQRSLINGTEDSGGLVVLEKVTDEVVQQLEPELRKSKGIGIQGILDLNFNYKSLKEQGMRPVGCKWIFKRKLKVDGTVEKFKAGMVIQGFKQKSGVDYFDTYAPVIRIGTIRLPIAMASIYNLIIHQMNQPQGFTFIRWM